MNKFLAPVLFVLVLVSGTLAYNYQVQPAIHQPVIELSVPRSIADNREAQLLINNLNNVNRGQTVILHIDSEGGLVSVGKKIRNAIEGNRGNVIAHVNGIAASMACDIMLSCPTIKFSSKSRVLFHVSRAYYVLDDHGIKIYLVNGKVPDRFAGRKVHIQFPTKLAGEDLELYPLYDKILNDEEMDKVFKQRKDLWLPGSEVQKRLQGISR